MRTVFHTTPVSIGNLSLQEWPFIKSLVTSSSISEAMSDRESAEQQRKEEQDAMAAARDPSLVSEELIRTGQWIKDTRGVLTMSPRTEGFWSHPKTTAVNATSGGGVLEGTR